MEFKEEIFELIRDQFTWATTLMMAFLSITLSRVNEKPALLSLGLYLFLLVFISFNSAHVLAAQKKRPGFIVHPNERQHEISVPKYPALHPFAIGGLAISVVMLVSAFFVPSFQSIFSPVITDTPTATSVLVLNTEIPTATNTETPTPSATAIETPTETPTPMLVVKLDCFDSNIWTPYKYTNPPIFIRKEDKCWEFNSWGFTPRDNGMFIAPPITVPGIGHGIYTSIDNITKISLKLTVKKFDINKLNSANISIGIIDNDMPGLSTSRVIYYHYNPEISTDMISIETGEDAEYKEVLRPVLEIGKSQELSIQTDGPIMTIFINQVNVAELSIPFDERAFWIGYSVPDYGELIATISDLEIK